MSPSHALSPFFLRLFFPSATQATLVVIKGGARVLWNTSIQEASHSGDKIWSRKNDHIILAPTPLAIFSFFMPSLFPVSFSSPQQVWSVTIQALTPRILILKNNQKAKFGTLKKPMFSSFDAVIFFNLMGY